MTNMYPKHVKVGFSCAVTVTSRGVVVRSLVGGGSKGGLLCSTFSSSAPSTIPQSSSTVEFLEQVDLFGTQFSSSSRNMRFL